MSSFPIREPISTLTHVLGFLAAFPTTWFLIRAARRRMATDRADTAFHRGKIAGFAVFGMGMAACYGASAAYHSLGQDPRTIDLLRRLDLVGIFLLIAGTFTPSAWVLMRPRPRRAAMVVVWGISAVCGTAVLLGRPFPTWLATGIYVTLGWGMVACYLDIRREHDRDVVRLLPTGGALYTVGAAINLALKGELLPGIGGHEIFHVFVLAGTATHVTFLFRVAAPAGVAALHQDAPRAAAGSGGRPRPRSRVGV